MKCLLELFIKYNPKNWDEWIQIKLTMREKLIGQIMAKIHKAVWYEKDRIQLWVFICIKFGFWSVSQEHFVEHCNLEEEWIIFIVLSIKGTSFKKSVKSLTVMTDSWAKCLLLFKNLKTVKVVRESDVFWKKKCNYICTWQKTNIYPSWLASHI